MKLEAILDNLDEVVHLVDRNMKILFINKAVEKLSRGRIKKEEAVGKNLYDVFHFLKEKDIDKEYEKVFSTGESLKTEEWTEYYGEAIYTVTTKIPIKDIMGRTKQVLTIIRDLTDIKKIEESLRRMAEQYSNIVELAREGICIDDENEKMVYANEAMAKILGCRREELIGKSIFDFVDEKGKKVLEEQVKVRRKGESSRYELNVYSKDGDIRTLLISASPLFIKGKYAGSISVNLDITERKKAEEKLKRMLEREREFKLRTAHYFFNPITIAKGYIHLSKEETEGRHRENLEKALIALDRIEKVIKNIVIKGEIVE